MMILQVIAGILLAYAAISWLHSQAAARAQSSATKWQDVHARQERRAAAWALVAAAKQIHWSNVNSDAAALVWWAEQSKAKHAPQAGLPEFWEAERSREDQIAASNAWYESQKPLTAEADAAASAIRGADRVLDQALFDNEVRGEFGYSFDPEETERREKASKARWDFRRQHGLSNADREFANFLVDSDGQTAAWKALTPEQQDARLDQESASAADPIAAAKHKAKMDERDGGRGYGDGAPFRLAVPSVAEEQYRLAYAAWHAQ